MGQTVSFYQTTPDFNQKLQKQSDLTFGASGSASQTITIDDTKTYQQIDGFGASFTDSSAWLVYNKLTETQRNDAMQKLFDRTNGIALSFIRQPMGASDLAVPASLGGANFYSYDDMPAGQSDPTLANFSIEHDKAYIIPVLKQALTLNPNIKMMANPWSPPAWMKTNNSLLGTYNGTEGHLKPEAFEPLAQYFVKYIQAYEAEGIPTHYISMQNEPEYAPDGYTGMKLTAQDEINLLVNNIGPAFAKAGIKAKVMVWDHNWDNTGYAMTILKDPKASAIAAGSAWHHYAGNPSAMSTVHDAFPDKDIWETEASGGTWQNQSTAFSEESIELINSMRNWAKSYVLWNMVLDQNHGPVGRTTDGKHGCDTCRGLLTVTWQNGSPSSFNTELDYYVLGHASKFLFPGAYRINSDMVTAASIYDVAFRNPDGSIVLYLFNNGTSDQSFNVKQGGKFFTATVKAGSLATFVWSPPSPPAVALSHSPNGLSLKSGQQGSIDLTVSPLTGTPSVTLGCQVLGVAGNVSTSMACQIDNPNMTFTDSTSQTTTVWIKPANATVGLLRNTGFPWTAGAGLIAGLPLLGIVFGCASRKRGALGMMLMVVIAAGALISCGGGGGGSTPPPTPVVTNAATPMMSPSSTTFSDTLSVTITSATPGATIYYTLDGTAPSPSSTKYTGPVNLTSPTTVKAIATASGYANSMTATGAYAMAYTLVVTSTSDAGAPVSLTVPISLN